MKIDVKGTETFASTGGRDFNPKGEVILFLHGSGQNHLGYALQHRYFANRGWQAITPDFPGHGLSKGDPLTSIEQMADWVIDFMDAANIPAAHCVGHSQGGLILLELAARYRDRVRTATFTNTATAIPVNEMLVGLAETKEPKAIAAMMDWGHGALGHIHDHTMPGTSHMVLGARLMANNAPGALFHDLSACNAYTTGPEAAANITCPTLTIVSVQDKMTPIKQGRKLHAILKGDYVELSQAGHMAIAEAPFEVNRAIKAFITTHAQSNAA